MRHRRGRVPQHAPQRPMFKLAASAARTEHPSAAARAAPGRTALRAGCRPASAAWPPSAAGPAGRQRVSKAQLWPRGRGAQAELGWAVPGTSTIPHAPRLHTRAHPHSGGTHLQGHAIHGDHAWVRAVPQQLHLPPEARGAQVGAQVQHLRAEEQEEGRRAARRVTGCRESSCKGAHGSRVAAGQAGQATSTHLHCHIQPVSRHGQFGQVHNAVCALAQLHQPAVVLRNELQQAGNGSRLGWSSTQTGGGQR